MDHHDNSVLLASIVIDNRFQTRAAMDQTAIEEYIDAIRVAGCWPFPPIKIVSQYLVDGFHRIEAAQRVAADPKTSVELRKSLQSIPCERVSVDLTVDNIPMLALQHALAANHTHGLRRSNADKRRAVELALKSWIDKSDREIATLTGTSHPFVGRVRGEMALETLPLERKPDSLLEDPLGGVETLPPDLEPESVPDDLREVETLPLGKQRASVGHGKRLEKELRSNDLDPEEAAKRIKSIAQQHREKLVRAIGEYHRVNPNSRERGRLVKLVQSVSLW
jgi:hypothetical protein